MAPDMWPRICGPGYAPGGKFCNTEQSNHGVNWHAAANEPVEELLHRSILELFEARYAKERLSQSAKRVVP